MTLKNIQMLEKEWEHCSKCGYRA